MSRTYVIGNESDEYVPLSWYAGAQSGATELEMVYEVTDHRPVWGLTVGAKAVRFKAMDVEISALSRPVNEVVGTIESAERMVQLVLTASGVLDVDALMKLAKDQYEKHFKIQGTTIFYTRKHFENVSWQTYGTLPRRSIKSVFLQNNLEEEILKDVKRFLGDATAYARIGRPYKRVYCLHGPPGTGKTSVVMAIAGALKRNLAIFNVDSLRDDTFIELLSSRNKDAVLLF